MCAQQHNTSDTSDLGAITVIMTLYGRTAVNSIDTCGRALLGFACIQHCAAHIDDDHALHCFVGQANRLYVVLMGDNIVENIINKISKRKMYKKKNY